MSTSHHILPGAVRIGDLSDRLIQVCSCGALLLHDSDYREAHEQFHAALTEEAVATEAPTLAVAQPSDYLAELFDEILIERQRANVRHGITSMEATKWWHARRLAILTEEVGEVAKAFNERDTARLGIDHPAFMADLRDELIQVAAMAVGWLAGIDGHALPMVLPPEGHEADYGPPGEQEHTNP